MPQAKEAATQAAEQLASRDAALAEAAAKVRAQAETVAALGRAKEAAAETARNDMARAAQQAAATEMALRGQSERLQSDCDRLGVKVGQTIRFSKTRLCSYSSQMERMKLILFNWNILTGNDGFFVWICIQMLYIIGEQTFITCVSGEEY